jgi:hypothetical protein
MGVSPHKLPAHSAVVLAEALDITQNHRIIEPGKYSVQFEGYGLDIGEIMRIKLPDDFGRPVGGELDDFLLAATNKFPSNVVKIDVRR